jgi:hypothetical protein
MKKFTVNIVSLDDSRAVYINGVYAFEQEGYPPSAADLCAALGVECETIGITDDDLTSEGKFPKHLSRIKGLRSN